jgi:hypothetical protein
MKGSAALTATAARVLASSRGIERAGVALLRRLGQVGRGSGFVRQVRAAFCAKVGARGDVR